MDKVKVDTQQSLVRAISRINEHNITSKLTDVDVRALTDIIRDAIEEAAIAGSVVIPQVKGSFGITCSPKGVIGKHPVNGMWVMIAQIPDRDGNIRYYTNGVRQKVHGD